ncbi:MAG: hypothetical protein F6K54_03015 [Okeania sp. SIO3B5]|uniref:hypothetical protein n=1 Tax=Okeania sp. SIO3B5 TaxID=2607811 RepID=UPI001400D3FF|nr:hypothetical protein [Okeania sp. SIO3B5]NEO52144.1 hypothetical protein [Okeania sp. SIO3B5]
MVSKVSLSYTLRILEAKKVFTNYVKKQPEKELLKPCRWGDGEMGIEKPLTK